LQDGVETETITKGVMNMTCTSKSMTIACVAGVLAIGSTGSYAASCVDAAATYPANGCALPGVVAGSFPYFENEITVDYDGKKLEKKGYFKLKASSVKEALGDIFAADDTTTYDIEKPKFKFKAKVGDPAIEKVALGNLSIKGKIDGQKFTVKAKIGTSKNDLGAYDVSADGLTWGFNTTEITCKNLPTPCTTDEVVYLNLATAVGGAVKESTDAIAVTSVPVPAAAWLFGSGLLGLIGVSRRSSLRT
jgi:hypothetical protein